MQKSDKVISNSKFEQNVFYDTYELHHAYRTVKNKWKLTAEEVDAQLPPLLDVNLFTFLLDQLEANISPVINDLTCLPFIVVVE